MAPPRPIATATVSFGLVSIPCHLHSASETSRKVSFKFLSPDGNRVKQQYVDAKTGNVVPRPELQRGYEFAKGQFVTFSTEELKALQAKATQTIEIKEFVALDKIDRTFVGKTYYLSAAKGGAKAYRLLAAALERTGWAALATYAARGKQYLVVVRPAGSYLVLEQLHYAHEVRAIDDVPLEEKEVDEAELGLAVALIEQRVAEDFEPDSYHDEVGDRMLEAIEKKVADGTQITETMEEEPAAQVIDLMAALRASFSKPSGESPETEPQKRATGS